MPTIHPGATLAPYFDDFLPAWAARQPWYAGTGTPSLTPVGYFRLEDPAGEVGMETHLLSDGSTLYQLPLTYRGAAIDGGAAAGALVATAEHSVLGTRWIYDAPADPVWRSELLRLVRSEAVSEPSRRRGVAPAEAHGRLVRSGTFDDAGLEIEVVRTLTPGCPAATSDVVGMVLGAWQPQGSEVSAVTGCLNVVRERTGEAARRIAPV